MKKVFSFLFVFLCLGSAFAQGSIGAKGFVTDGGTFQNSVATISHSLGTPFNGIGGGISEGLLQTQTVGVRDTLLLLSDEVSAAGYIPGYDPQNDEPDGFTEEGYDKYVQHFVYSVTCQGDLDTTMIVSGHPTISLDVPEPAIEPNDGLVALALTHDGSAQANPYDYAVGSTTDLLWTATYGTQSKTCTPTVKVNYFPCPTVTGADGSAYTYPVTRLAYYCWTARNARAESYGDASAVDGVTTYPDADVATYGHLYTWPAATGYAGADASFTQGICPNGWHIPNATEMGFLLSAFESRPLMSTTDWLPTTGTDDYGFSVLPAGFYNSENEMYEDLRVRAYLWTTESVSTVYHACLFGADCGIFEDIVSPGTMGYSVRCVLNYW